MFYVVLARELQRKTITVLVMTCFGILMLQLSTVTGLKKSKDCGTYDQSYFYCSIGCRPPGKCEEIIHNGNSCSVCVPPNEVDPIQCEGIQFTGPCRHYYGFTDPAEAGALCKDNVYYMRNYYQPIDGKNIQFTCYHCSKGLHCDE